MRWITSRLAVAFLAASSGAALIIASGDFAAAQPIFKALPAVPPGGVPAGKDKKEDDSRPARDRDVPFAFPYERDSKSQLRAARDYLTFKEIPWNTVCPLLQKILDTKSDSFFDVEYKVGNRTEINRISVKTEANRIIASFPKDGLEFYQQSYGQAASAVLDEAIKNNYDLTQLADLSQRYFHTKAGAEATILLAGIYLERGNYLEAAYGYERLLTRPLSEDVLTARTLFKAALALKRSGDPRHGALLPTVLEQLRAATLRNGLLIGRKTYTSEQLRAEILRPIQSLRPVVSVGNWAGRYGNAQRNGTIEGGPPFLVPMFSVAMRYFGESEANTWVKEELERLYDRDNKSNKAAPLPAFFPVTTSDLVVYRSYDGVYAIAIRDQSIRGKFYAAGSLIWFSKPHYGISQIIAETSPPTLDPRERGIIQEWWKTYKTNMNAASLLVENPALGSLSHDGQNVYYLDDIAIPPPPTVQDPNFGGFPGNQQIQVPRKLTEAIRASQLNAVDLNTGVRLWILGRADGRAELEGDERVPLPLPLSEEEADKTSDAYRLCLSAVFLGPPLPLNGRLYVLIEHEGVERLLCLDPKNLVAAKDDPNRRVPGLLWSQKLGRANSPIPGDPIRRTQGAFLAAGDGIIICPTNSGAIVGVDIMSRSLLWAHAYRYLATPPRSNLQQPLPFNPQSGQVLPQQVPVDRWRAAAPIVSGGRVVVAAYDSDKLECLDIRTGRLIWSIPRNPNYLYVGGVINDKVIVVGKSEVWAYDLVGEEKTKLEPKLAWKTALAQATPTGHGIAGRTAYYLPIRQEKGSKDPAPTAEVWAFNPETGEISSKTVARRREDELGRDQSRYGIGNLVYQDGLVVSQSPWEVAVYPQLEVKKAEMDKRLAANPNDPIGLLARGELLLDEGKIKNAIIDLKAAEKNNLPEDKRSIWREKLYIAYTELLRDHFEDGESILKEYASLCELPLEGAEPEFERSRREDETLRRKRFYIYLLAKGRETQGRFGEAFDQYLALARLGESKTLFEIPDEPSVRMRPDVWARGRIARMIRLSAQTPERKELDERVNREWGIVKSGTDLNRLREFVSLFGPYFPQGSEAEYLLAETLLKTHNEEDFRDAQVHLGQIRANAADLQLRARATELLARLMIQAGLLEDAVSLYLQLGKDFPNVVIRDGKTGVDFLSDLLTDKRLLPYLEPGRFPFPTRVRVEEKTQVGGINQNGMFEVEIQGDLFPIYRRLRFVMQMNPGGNMTWTLRAFDRVTGVERAHFSDLSPPQIYNPGGFQSAKFIQASGHLILVQLGAWVYCLDLAEKTEKWRKNLLGDAALAPNSIQMSDNRDSGEEVVVVSSDGYRVTLGKSAIIQPGYICLLTRDGLEVVEAATRRELWKRRNIPDRTHIAGDSQFIVLIENGPNGKPISTKILRAVDGMIVDGAGDASKILAAAKSYRIFGRTVLLNEEENEKKIVRLYDLTTAKDIWRKELAGKSIPLRSLHPEWTGTVKDSGEIEIASTRTGLPIATLQIDPKRVADHLKGCQEAILLTDSERFYVILDRPSVAARNAARFNNYSLRTQKINGTMYCFDRTSFKRLWFVEDILDNQLLLLERFADLPVIVAGGVVNEKGTTVFRVVVIEKERGMLRFNKALPYIGSFFGALSIDQKTGTIELLNNNLKLRIHSEDEKTAGQ